MSLFVYTATRNLAPGTTLNDTFEREFRLVSHARNESSIGKKNVALGGAIESILHRREIIYKCVTSMVEPRSIDEQHIQEFLASVSNGEDFTFDRYGNPGQPVDAVNCILISKNFAQSELGKKFHRYGFTIRES